MAPQSRHLGSVCHLHLEFQKKKREGVDTGMEGRRELHTLIDLTNHTSYMHSTEQKGKREGWEGTVRRYCPNQDPTRETCHPHVDVRTSKCCDTMNVFAQRQNRCMTPTKGALHNAIRRPGLCGIHSGGAFDIVAT